MISATCPRGQWVDKNEMCIRCKHQLFYIVVHGPTLSEWNQFAYTLFFTGYRITGCPWNQSGVKNHTSMEKLRIETTQTLFVWISSTPVLTSSIDIVFVLSIDNKETVVIKHWLFIYFNNNLMFYHEIMFKQLKISNFMWTVLWINIVFWIKYILLGCFSHWNWLCSRCLVIWIDGIWNKYWMTVDLKVWHVWKCFIFMSCLIFLKDMYILLPVSSI